MELVEAVVVEKEEKAAGSEEGGRGSAGAALHSV